MENVKGLGRYDLRLIEFNIVLLGSSTERKFSRWFIVQRKKVTSLPPKMLAKLH